MCFFFYPLPHAPDFKTHSHSPTRTCVKHTDPPPPTFPFSFFVVCGGGWKCRLDNLPLERCPPVTFSHLRRVTFTPSAFSPPSIILMVDWPRDWKLAGSRPSSGPQDALPISLEDTILSQRGLIGLLRGPTVMDLETATFRKSSPLPSISNHPSII